MKKSVSNEKDERKSDRSVEVKMYKERNEAWLNEAARMKKNVRKSGERIERFTKGAVKIHSILISGEDILEPFLMISVEMIDKKRKEDINAFEDLIREIKEKHLRFTLFCVMGEPLEKMLKEYKSALAEIRKLAKELLR